VGGADEKKKRSVLSYFQAQQISPALFHFMGLEKNGRSCFFFLMDAATTEESTLARAHKFTSAPTPVMRVPHARQQDSAQAKLIIILRMSLSLPSVCGEGDANFLRRAGARAVQILNYRPLPSRGGRGFFGFAAQTLTFIRCAGC
jgi:hypothetical protein